MEKKKRINTNDRGNRIGDSHPRAKLSDEQVEEIRELYDDGFYSYLTLAKRFGVDKWTIRDIVKFRRRNVTPSAYPYKPKRPPRKV